METYSSNFTVHGLYKVWHGYCIERLFWGLTTIITFYLIIDYGSMYITRYLAYEHCTLVDYEEHQSMELPIITLCSTRTFVGTFFCYRNQSFFEDLPCNLTKEKVSLSYQIGDQIKNEWTSLDQSEDGCFVFDGNTSIAPGKGFVNFLYNEPHMKYLSISYQTRREQIIAERTCTQLTTTH